MFILSEIADKIEFKMPSFPETKNLSDEERNKVTKEFGAEIILKLFKGLYKAKKEVENLIEDITGKNAKDMSLKEIKDTLIGIFKQDGVLDFFK